MVTLKTLILHTQNKLLIGQNMLFCYKSTCFDKAIGEKVTGIFLPELNPSYDTAADGGHGNVRFSFAEKTLPRAGQA